MEKQQFAYVLRPAPGFEHVRESQLSDEQRKVLERHFEYVRQLTAKGKMILIARSVEQYPFGVAIVDAEAEEEARWIMENDPIVLDGMMTASLHPFRLPLMRHED